MDESGRMVRVNENKKAHLVNGEQVCFYRVNYNGNEKTVYLYNAKNELLKTIKYDNLNRHQKKNPKTKEVKKPHGWIRFPGLMGPIFVPANRVDCITPFKSSGLLNFVANFLGLSNSHNEDKKKCRIFTAGDSAVYGRHQTSMVVRLSPQEASDRLARFWKRMAERDAKRAQEFGETFIRSVSKGIKRADKRQKNQDNNLFGYQPPEDNKDA